MLTRPTKQDFRNIFMMIEASNKLGYLATLEESLDRGSMSFLLAEDVSEDEAEKLDSAVTQTRQGLEALAGSMPATKMENVKKYFQDLVAELPDNGEMVKLAIKGDTKAIKKRAQAASAAMTQIQKARDSFANSVALLGGQLAKTTFAKEQKPDILQLSLAELAAKEEADRGDFPDEKTLRTGIERSFVPSKEAKGLFGKIAGWFKGKMGKELDKSVFTKDMLGLSLEELAGMVAEVRAADAKGDKGAEAAGAAMAGMEDDLSSDGEAKGEGGGGEAEAPTGEDAELAPEEIEAADAEAEKVAASLGSGPIGKLELVKLLKRWPEISKDGDKASRHRRSFRQAVNKAAGKEVFEEGFSRRQAQLITERIVNLDTPPQDEFSDPMADHDTGWTTDELVKQRWMRMAGFKGY